MAQDDPILNDFEQAVADRLAKLRALPVETSALDHALRGQVLPQRRPPIRWMRPISAVAAAVVLVASVTIVLLTLSGQPVMASAAQMAQFHQDIIENRVPVVKVDSIDQASKVLAGNWPGTPDLPESPQAHVMACCMKEIKDKKVACVLLESENVKVTMSVANAADMKMPKSPTITRQGITYHVESFGALNMVSTQRGGRWVCLIGELPADRLIALAAGLQF